MQAYRGVERLERRLLFLIFVDPGPSIPELHVDANGIIRLTGTAGDDNFLVVNTRSDEIEGQGRIQVETKSGWAAAPLITTKGIIITANRGNDSITIRFDPQYSIPVTIYGGAGNDDITTG